MLRDKAILITGASSGLGAALALELAGRGARLGLFSIEAARQHDVAAACRERGARAHVVVGDVTSPSDCKRFLDESAAELGSIDALVANAGISMWARFDEVEDLDVFRRLMDVNYLGAVHCIHYALPHLKRSRGLVVAITSIQAKISVPLHTGYVASKHALQGFCDSLRMELRGSGVDVLTVLPHWLRGTELREHAFGQDGRHLGRTARKHTSESVSVEHASRLIVGAMELRRRDLVFPWKLPVLMAVSAVWPSLADSIVLGAVQKEG